MSLPVTPALGFGARSLARSMCLVARALRGEQISLGDLDLGLNDVAAHAAHAAHKISDRADFSETECRDLGEA